LLTCREPLRRAANRIDRERGACRPLRALLLAGLLLPPWSGCGSTVPDAGTPRAGTGGALARISLSAAGTGSVYEEVTVRVGVYEGAALDCAACDPTPPVPPLVVSVLSASAGGGVIRGIPAGLDRILLAEGLNAAGDVVSRGCVEGITIIPGANTTVQEPIRLAPTYPAPEIASITPPYAFPGDELAIQGTHFSPLPSENRVVFGDIAVTATSSSTEQITVAVPEDAVSGGVTVRVGRAVSPAHPFTVLVCSAGLQEKATKALGITPEGSRLYVGTYGDEYGAGPGRFTVLDTDTASPTYHEIVKRQVGDTTCYGVDSISFTPDGKLAYAPAAEETIVIDTDPASGTYHQEIGEIVTPGGAVYNPIMVSFTPDGNRAYICYVETGSIGVYDCRRDGGGFNQLIDVISLGPDRRLLWPWQMVLSPDGRRLFVVLHNARAVAVIDTDPLSGTYHRIVSWIEAGLYPHGIALMHEGRWLCVADQMADALLVLDAGAALLPGDVPEVRASIPLPHFPAFPVPSPSERALYVYGQPDVLCAIDTSDPSPENWFRAHDLPLPRTAPQNLVLTPDQGRAYLSCRTQELFGIRLGRSHPVVTGLSPTTADEGALVTIHGAGFPSAPEQAAVRFGDVNATPQTSDPTRIQVRVPRGAASGPVTVLAGGLESNRLHLTVTPAEVSRIPTVTFLQHIDASPDGAFVLATQSPIPAEDPAAVLMDANPWSETFNQVLWQGPLGVSMGPVRFHPSARRAYLKVDNIGLVALDLGAGGARQPTFRVVDPRSMSAMDFGPDGRVAYVCQPYSNILYAIDITEDQPVREPLPVGEEGNSILLDVRVHPQRGDRAYVLSKRAPQQDRVYVVDLDRWETVGSVPAAQEGMRSALSPDGSVLFVTDVAAASLHALDTAAMENGVEGDELLATIPVGVNPQWVCHAPDRPRLYVVNTGAATFSVIDTDPESPTFLARIQDVPTLPGSTGMAITPDGSRAYLVSPYDRQGQVQVILLHEMP